jgi:hypothetical protein
LERQDLPIQATMMFWILELEVSKSILLREESGETKDLLGFHQKGGTVGY